MTNPLLALGELPDYAAIEPAQVTPALDVLLQQAEAALALAVSDGTAADYDTLSLVLDVPLERLSLAWRTVGHLHAVLDTPELRAAYNDNLGRVTEFHARLGADERLYAKYKAVSQASDAAALGAARRRALDNALREFVLGGAELQGAARDRFAQIQQRSAELSQAFDEHVLDATDGFELFVDEQRLDGVPDDVRARARTAAAAAGRAGCRLSLHAPMWQPVMQYAHDRALREQLYRAHVTRASELGPAALDNSAVMQELLALRAEEAALLGYPDFAALSLVRKMAESPEQVGDFLDELARRARPFAERDLAELRRFAAEALGIADLQAWDQAYAAEALKHSRFAFSDQEVRQYFTEPRVLAGLFGIVERLFEVRIRADVAPTWHDSVRFYRIERQPPGGGPAQLLGHFYLDPYARAGKQPGAWMSNVRDRWARPEPPGRLQTPLAHLVCNFSAPHDGRPALLTHDDVITLFHEFGHGLHHLLTQVDEAAVAGSSGMEWDAVELPSQFMENFCWEWEVLSQLTAHVDSGEPLPRALFERMRDARNFHSGLQTLRQIEYASFDLRVHHRAAAPAAVLDIADEVRRAVAVLPAPPFNRYPHSFAHIFAGGYAAGYYSYKWAEVLSADAFAAFEESGVFDLDTGRRYRREILESGGSRPAMDSFRAFRGRAPSIDALLRHQGMAIAVAPAGLDSRP
jgi:oligopeptidase A